MIKIRENIFSLVAIGLTIISFAHATLNPAGLKCGEKQCLSTEYCSSFDHQCQPCSKICDVGHNHDPALCANHCQEYLHDERYVLRDEIKRLKNLVTVSLILTCISLLGLLLICLRFLWTKKLRKMVQAGWLRKKWVKKATNNNRVKDDAEAGSGCKQNGLKLAMPTISATVVAPSSNVSDGTPNTTSTPLSRRHPSEDATLDYAYDNPAMTPSPEAVQPRAKRERKWQRD